MAALKNTPWGKTQSEPKIYGPGVAFYSTSSHGGFKLDRKQNAMVPEYMRTKGGWYEEDSQWAIVAMVFPSLFTDSDLEMAERTLRNWNPDEYMQFTGKKLTGEDSFKLAEREFTEANRGNYVGISAVNDRDGMVLCQATLGGVRDHNKTKPFLVPAGEYETRSPHGFVIDPVKHAWKTTQ